MENIYDKLQIIHANIYKYDGIEEPSVYKEQFPVVSNSLPYECQGPWKAEDTAGDSSYTFKK